MARVRNYKSKLSSSKIKTEFQELMLWIRYILTFNVTRAYRNKKAKQRQRHFKILRVLGRSQSIEPLHFQIWWLKVRSPFLEAVLNSLIWEPSKYVRRPRTRSAPIHWKSIACEESCSTNILSCMSVMSKKENIKECLLYWSVNSFIHRFRSSAT